MRGYICEKTHAEISGLGSYLGRVYFKLQEISGRTPFLMGILYLILNFEAADNRFV